MNVFNFNVIDVAIPARYGSEKSKIKYSRYIIKVSFLLLGNYFWRLKTKYLLKKLKTHTVLPSRFRTKT